MSQVPENQIFPPFPADGFQMPFYYSAASFFWVFFKAPATKMQRHLEGTGLAVARFTDVEDGCGVVALNFQNYAALLGMTISTVNEVEMNLHSYPVAKEGETPLVSLADYLRGQEQTKWIGSFRLHVPADNEIAVKAGISVFGERTFLCPFGYNVPAPNNYGKDGRSVTTWEYIVDDPSFPNPGQTSITDPSSPYAPQGGGCCQEPYIYHLSADLSLQEPVTGNASPLTLYSCLPGGPYNPPGGPNQRLIASRWNLFGLYRDYYPLRDAVKAKVKLTLCNQCQHVMAQDLRDILGDNAEPLVVRIFHSNPAAVENRAFYVVPGAD